MHNPLIGKKVLVSRSKEQAGVLSQKIAELGGIAIEIPLIAIKEKRLPDSTYTSLLQSEVAWVIFTSSNGVHAFFRQWDHQTILPTKIAVIGEKTNQTLFNYGYHADFIPSKYVAEQFVTDFIPHISKQDKILVVKGNLARDHIVLELKKVSEEVKEIILYETSFPKESEVELVEHLQKNTIDILFFTSTSTVEHFMGIVKKHHLVTNIRNCIIVSIGPITTECLKRYDIEADITAIPYTIDAMIEELVIYVTNRIGERKHD